MFSYKRIQGIIGSALVVLGIFYFFIPTEKALTDVLIIFSILCFGLSFFIYDLYKTHLRIDIDQWGVRKRFFGFMLHACPWENVVEVELNEKNSAPADPPKYIKITYKTNNNKMAYLYIKSSYLLVNDLGIIIYEIEKHAPEGLRRTFDLFSLEIS